MTKMQAGVSPTTKKPVTVTVPTTPTTTKRVDLSQQSTHPEGRK